MKFTPERQKILQESAIGRAVALYIEANDHAWAEDGRLQGMADRPNKARLDYCRSLWDRSDVLRERLVDLIDQTCLKDRPIDKSSG